MDNSIKFIDVILACFITIAMMLCSSWIGYSFAEKQTCAKVGGVYSWDMGQCFKGVYPVGGVK